MPFKLDFTHLDFKEVTGQVAKDLFQFAALSKINLMKQEQDKLQYSYN